MADSARIVVEVVAGLVPGDPMRQFTKSWVITSAQWYAEDADQQQLLMDVHIKGVTYLTSLNMQIPGINWTRMDTVYF